MATPDFVLQLREYVGHAHLWMPGCTGIVVRPCAEAGRERGEQELSFTAIAPDSVEILCVKRADNGQWTPITGIIDPGEEPACAVERETLEEAGVKAQAIRLISVDVVGPVTYPNGDVSSYLDTAFLLKWVGGEPFPADGENTEAAFFRADRLPAMNDRFTRTVARALSGEPSAAFVSSMF